MFKVFLLLVIAQSVLAFDRPESFVVGGNDAARGQFPHVVSFRYFPFSLHGCSGSIVSSRWVLTAAHCIEGSPPFEMVMGVNELSDFGTRFQYEELVIHPSYRTILNPLSTNDIGLVKTDFLIEFNELIQPIRIRKYVITRADNAIIAGFGSTDMFPGDPSLPIGDDRFPRMSEKLQYLQLNLIVEVVPLIARNTQMCTYNNIEQGLCYGDSGSALLLNNEVIGVASRAILPCARGMPDIFTRVSHFAQWIDSYITEAVTFDYTGV